jgi:hypothetical protein
VARSHEAKANEEALRDLKIEKRLVNKERRAFLLRWRRNKQVRQRRYVWWGPR